jgi:hypothetical protein
MTFGGMTGLLSVQGGNGKGNGAPGGGGRMAVIVNATAQDSAPLSGVQFAAGSGVSYYNNGLGERPGTIYLSTLSLLTERLQGGELIVPGLQYLPVPPSAW